MNREPFIAQMNDPLPNRLAAPGHVPELDGLRGIAVLLVFFHHSIAAAGLGLLSTADKVLGSMLSAGWIGVDIFFALSGYLITGILLRSKLRPNYFRDFYAKRTLRIFPLYYLFLLGIFVLFASPLRALYEAGGQFSSLEHAQGWFWFYLQNWYFVHLGSGSQVPVTQLWSLAVEEQFYLVWPLVVFLLPPRRTLQTCFFLIVVAPCLRLFLLRMGWSDTSIYMATHTRMDALLVGALLATYLHLGKPLTSATTSAIAAVSTFALGLALCLVLDHSIRRSGPAMEVVGLLAIPASAAFMILATLRAKRGALWNRFLRWNFLQISGKFSYAMYIFHPPILWGSAALLTSRHFLGPAVHAFSINYGMFTAACLCTTMLVSALSWWAFERHFLALKRFFSGGEILDANRGVIRSRGIGDRAESR